MVEKTLGALEEISLGFSFLQHSPLPEGASKDIRSRKHHRRRIGQGTVAVMLICGQMGTFLGKARNIRGDGPFTRVWEVLGRHLEAKNQELWLTGVLVAIRPFRLVKYGHIELLPNENARDASSVLSPDAPKPKSIFIMLTSCFKPLLQQHKPYMGKGWACRVKIQTLDCVTYLKPGHFPQHHACIGQTCK